MIPREEINKKKWNKILPFKVSFSRKQSLNLSNYELVWYIPPCAWYIFEFIFLENRTILRKRSILNFLLIFILIIFYSCSSVRNLPNWSLLVKSAKSSFQNTEPRMKQTLHRTFFLYFHVESPSARLFHDYDPILYMQESLFFKSFVLHVWQLRSKNKFAIILQNTYIYDITLTMQILVKYEI